MKTRITESQLREIISESIKNIFEENYGGIFDDDKAFDDFLRHDVANSPEWKEFEKKHFTPSFNEKARRQAKKVVDNERKRLNEYDEEGNVVHISHPNFAGMNLWDVCCCIRDVMNSDNTTNYREGYLQLKGFLGDVYDYLYEKATLREGAINEVGDTDKGQYALGQVAARQASKGDAYDMCQTHLHAWRNNGRPFDKEHPNRGKMSDSFNKGMKDYQEKNRKN